MTPLYFASKYGHSKIIEYLLKKSAYVNVCDYVNKSPLYVASENGHVEVVNILLKRHGVACLLNTKYSTCPLQIAVLCNRTDVAHQLIRRENQHMKYKGNCHLFQILTDLRQFEMLVACDVSVQQRKQERLSDAIWNLILGGNCDDLECLLKLGLDINQCNDKGRPLVCRLGNGSHCNNGLQAKTRLLLDRGADMHLRDVKCMFVLEHTSRSSCEIKITYEKKKGRCKNMEFEAYDEYEKYRIYCNIFQTY